MVWKWVAYKMWHISNRLLLSSQICNENLKLIKLGNWLLRKFDDALSHPWSPGPVVVVHNTLWPRWPPLCQSSPCVPPTILNYLPKFTSCKRFEIGVLAKCKSGGPFLSVDQIDVGLENWENDKTLVWRFQWWFSRRHFKQSSEPTGLHISENKMISR